MTKIRDPPREDVMVHSPRSHDREDHRLQVSSVRGTNVGTPTTARLHAHIRKDVSEEREHLRVSTRIPV